MAVRVDSEMPQIQAVKTDALHPPEGTIPDIDVVCRIGTEEVPVLSVPTLGKDPSQGSELCRAGENGLGS
jgi:hypothetical protein